MNILCNEIHKMEVKEFLVTPRHIFMFSVVRCPAQSCSS